MNQKYKEALSEVEFILSHFDKSDTEKIPQNFKDFITDNKCKWYEITEDDELSEEALAILAIVYRKFLAPLEERVELDRKFHEKLKKEMEELKKIEEVAEANSNSEINYSFTKSTSIKNIELMQYEDEKWYIKLIEKVKKYFNIG